jgi:chaperonin cofactor prefoldin
MAVEPTLAEPEQAEKPMEDNAVEVLKELHRQATAALSQQLAAKNDEIETLNCRILSLEHQNTELRTRLTVVHGDLIKSERGKKPGA